MDAITNPRRRVLLVLRLGADTREDLLHELEEIERRVRRGELTGESCSGGYSSGWSMSLTEDPSVTHDSYFEAIKNAP